MAGEIFQCSDSSSRSANTEPTLWQRQAYLKFRRILFVTIPSNNHASPSGALPFLLPSATSPSTSTDIAPIPSNRIQRWTRQLVGPGKDDTSRSEYARHAVQEPDSGSKGAAPHDSSSDMRYEAYMALLDHRIRNAYASTSLSPCTIHC